MNIIVQQFQPYMSTVCIPIFVYLVMSVTAPHPLQREAVSDLLSHFLCRLTLLLASVHWFRLMHNLPHAPDVTLECAQSRVPDSLLASVR